MNIMMKMITWPLEPMVKMVLKIKLDFVFLNPSLTPWSLKLLTIIVQN